MQAPDSCALLQALKLNFALFIICRWEALVFEGPPPSDSMPDLAVVDLPASRGGQAVAVAAGDKLQVCIRDILSWPHSCNKHTAFAAYVVYIILSFYHFIRCIYHAVRLWWIERETIVLQAWHASGSCDPPGRLQDS
jgi:hypothetical protein